MSKMAHSHGWQLVQLGALLELSTGATTLSPCGLGFLWYGSRVLLGSVPRDQETLWKLPSF